MSIVLAFFSSYVGVLKRANVKRSDSVSSITRMIWRKPEKKKKNVDTDGQVSHTQLPTDWTKVWP